MRRRPQYLAASLAFAGVVASSGAWAQERTLQDFRYFRALSIDLQGRIPTRAEVAAFERPDFSVERWIDEKLTTPAYAERMRAVYMDLLRLEVSAAVNFNPASLVLRRQNVVGPDGRTMYIYYRAGQRRTRAETDGDFCFTQSEVGFVLDTTGRQVGTPTRVTQAALDANTVLVRPWWLYRDYRSASPTERYDATAWATRFPNFVPATNLQMEPDNRTPTAAIRICREEASASDTGTIYFSGRTRTNPPPYGRIINIPAETTYARTNRGMRVDCSGQVAFQSTTDCGCGPGLERCMPGNNSGNNPAAFTFPSRTPIGTDQPLDAATQAQDDWNLFWWSQETQRFIERMFLDNRDFRDVLTARDTWVNGPLANFYRNYASASCCSGAAMALGYVRPEPLTNPENIPASLLPHDTETWSRVTDRGPNAAGILTMPSFLVKYGSRRARAHVLYNAFLCREFAADNVELMPSTEVNLMRRPGCAACHTTLEPLSAYFSRVRENDWTWLPPSRFPVQNPMCTGTTAATMNANCRGFYDPLFSTGAMGMLQGAYGSPSNADAGPIGAGRAITQHPEFGACAAENVASALLGRSLGPDDADYKRTLTQTFVTGNYRMRALVRAVVLSDAYRNANNLTSAAWREGASR